MLTCFYDGQKIYIGDYLTTLPLRDLSRKNELLCPDPDCRQPVILRQGKYKRPHFAHKKGAGINCHFGVSESPEHIEGKRFISDLLRTKYTPDQVKLEEFLGSDQKADVLLDLGTQKYAFEILFSEQDGHTWDERNQKLSSVGIVPVWILGYRKPLSEIVESQWHNEPSKIKLGRAREAAAINAKIVQKLENRITRYSFHERSAWETVDKYKVVHVLSVCEGNSDFYLAYISQKSAAIWEGYTLAIDNSACFDPISNRFLPAEEIAANEAAKAAFQEWSEWKTRLKAIQAELLGKVLTYSKADRLERLPVVVENWDIFWGDVSDKDYDILLIEVALYIKIIRMKHFCEDALEEILMSWKFEWKEANYLLQWGEIGKFLKRLEKAGVLSYDEVGVWNVKGCLAR
jgi:hypothetical protein